MEILGESEIAEFRSAIASTDRALNEADTRHRIIDVLIHNVMRWPRTRVSVEEYIKPGFADYVLKRANGDALLFIEAKKEGSYFSLPVPSKKEDLASYIAIEKLITVSEIKSAIEQVRQYCVDIGCEYACVTNGHEWIFFKTFGRGQRWDALQAFVVRDSKFFADEFTRAYNALSYHAINEHSSLVTLLTPTTVKDRNLFFPKEHIAAYSHPITANKLAAALRPIVTRYFGIIDDNDTDFMNKCYVSEREYVPAFSGMRAMMEDSLSPYFKSYGVQQLNDTGKGGQIGGRLTKNIKQERRGEVLVLFGGKGSGKSTFLKRLLHHNPPPWLKHHCVIALVDLLKVPEKPSLIRDAIWDGLVEKLDSEQILSADREILLRDLFSDRYQTANRQELSGLAKNSETYNVSLNKLIADWKQDKPYCVGRLVDYHRKNGRGVVFVIDNTDQYSGENQDFCFTSAQEITSRYNCISIISMREERFHNSKVHGLLDAFQNSGFHISSPKPWEVFRKRLDYTISLIESNDPEKHGIYGKDGLIGDSATYLKILRREFTLNSSPLRNFLNACAQGDIRLSLDLFRSFALSGYTNVQEMLNEGSWNFQIHQVVKPMMIPDRYFYDEKLSDIPNIYQVRNNRNGSHFTCLRILRKLDKTKTASNPTYLPVASLKSYFADTFNMIDDLNSSLDILLKFKFIEANNRLDSYDGSLDSVKITSYGAYMLNDLAYQFAYLDLICTDCAFFDENSSNYIAHTAQAEYDLFVKGDRVARVEARLDRVEKFLNYLGEEEAREREHFALGMPEEEMFTARSKQAFSAEKERIIVSAKKQANRKTKNLRH